MRADHMHTFFKFWWITSNSFKFSTVREPGIYHFPVAREQQS